MDAAQFEARAEALVEQVGRVVVGQSEVVEQVLLGIFAKGHVLLEGVPGMGKTLLVRTLSRVLGCPTGRIQFTPDLMPSDVTGGNVFNQQTSAFEFVAGPVFTSLLLADEINRATAKTQSALLEAMQDRTVTVDGTTRELPKPFFVLATQNPVESQGTHPLPEAQLDRFLLKVDVHYPSRAAERQLLGHVADGFEASNLDAAGLEPICTQAEVIEMQKFTRQVEASPDLLDYVVDIIRKTREHRSVMLGASPRAAVALLSVARARAAFSGRDYVIPDDVKSLAAPTLRHRLILHPDAEFQGVSAEQCLQSILTETRVPGQTGGTA
ncbi:MAG: MoxR-like ATPase [Myxococcota bacterium]|jgi:MoxR-like ATPase